MPPRRHKKHLWLLLKGLSDRPDSLTTPTTLEAPYGFRFRFHYPVLRTI
jgi:hypothetical protein